MVAMATSLTRKNVPGPGYGSENLARAKKLLFVVAKFNPQVHTLNIPQPQLGCMEPP